MDVTFDPVKHEYRSPAGIVLPSVTQVLPDYPLGPDRAVEKARDRSNRVHKLTAMYDLGQSWSAKEHTADVIGYLDAWYKFLRDKKPDILEVERLGWHPQYHYAGTPDREMQWSKYPNVSDIKCTAAIQPEAALQTAGYVPICRHKPKKRFTIQLKPDGTYRLHEWSDPTDFSVFLSCLSVHRWRQKHKPIAVNYWEQELKSV